MPVSPLSPPSSSLSPAGISAVCAGLCWQESSLARCQTQSEVRKQALLHCVQILLLCIYVSTHKGLHISSKSTIQYRCAVRLKGYVRQENQSRGFYVIFPNITFFFQTVSAPGFQTGYIKK